MPSDEGNPSLMKEVTLKELLVMSENTYQMTWQISSKVAGIIRSSDPTDHLLLKTMTPGIVMIGQNQPFHSSYWLFDFINSNIYQSNSFDSIIAALKYQTDLVFF